MGRSIKDTEGADLVPASSFSAKVFPPFLLTLSPTNYTAMGRMIRQSTERLLDDQLASTGNLPTPKKENTDFALRLPE